MRRPSRMANGQFALDRIRREQFRQFAKLTFFSSEQKLAWLTVATPAESYLGTRRFSPSTTCSTADGSPT